uniref:LCR n=1 Tax=Cajanus cajan TaxID=3821 RepID=A0A151QNW2_CAJCA|nr:hypothetical protein KK1_047462 [Cajanus cajan]
MPFRINQAFLLGMLCIALVLDSGVGGGLFPGLSCQQGKCASNTVCDQNCHNSGFQKGGTCIGIIPGLIQCCCYK